MSSTAMSETRARAGASTLACVTFAPDGRTCTDYSNIRPDPWRTSRTRPSRFYTTLSRGHFDYQTQAGETHARPPIRRQGIPTMQRILMRRIQNLALSDSDEFVRQFHQIERIVNADDAS